jgi:hypothetical protein
MYTNEEAALARFFFQPDHAEITPHPPARRGTVTAATAKTSPNRGSTDD